MIQVAGAGPRVEKAGYTARIRTTGGRESGTWHNSDGMLDARLSVAGSERLHQP